MPVHQFRLDNAHEYTDIDNLSVRERVILLNWNSDTLYTARRPELFQRNTEKGELATRALTFRSIRIRPGRLLFPVLVCTRCERFANDLRTIRSMADRDSRPCGLCSFGLSSCGQEQARTTNEVARNESTAVASCKTHVRFGPFVLFANVGDKACPSRGYNAVSVYV